MRLIERQELKEKLDRGDDFKLVMTLGEWAFEAQHIPGSINIHSAKSLVQQLAVDDEIVVYCSNVDCIASQVAYHRLTSDGYTNVRRYAGGIEDWAAAGYELEGTGI